MNTNLLLDIGNIVMLIGTLLLIRAVIKDRKILKGYNPVGSILTMLGMITFDTFYVVINNQFSLWIAMVTTAYWFLASVYSVRIALENSETYWKIRAWLSDYADHLKA